MKSILSPEERERLALLVGEMEEKTAGELVTVVLARSDSYAAFRLGGAVAIAFLLACLGHLVWPDLSSMHLLGSQPLLALLLYWVLGWSPLLRLLVPAWVRDQAVHRRVSELFLAHGVTETRDRSGVLILSSELERRVEILADRGIHERVGAETWKAMLDELTHSIRQGKAEEGLASVIRRVGQELATHFPARHDDTNELPNAIVTER